MKKTFPILIFFAIFCGCTNTPDELILETIPKTNVEITTVHQGSISDKLELFASTIYLKRNALTAPIPAFITKVYVRLGDHVKQGALLFELESKEHRALNGQNIQFDSSLTNFGVIQIKASTSGIITTLDKPQTGDYVLEGAQLCTISESGDLAFQINVPYEFVKYVKIGSSCEIILPDNTSQLATITTPLTTMNLSSQTETFLAKSKSSLFLPENLIVKVLINKSNDNKKQILTNSCVQTDEMMQVYWVMKLINDSTAVRVPVNVGIKTENEIEIITPLFLPTDRIILTGSYGLPDTAFVKIVNP